MLVHRFFYNMGSDVTQTFMTQIIDLLKDVVDAKAEYPDAKVPAPSHVFHYEKTNKSNIPTIKQSKHEVTVVDAEDNGRQLKRAFVMNAPSEIIKLLVANPQEFNRISALPDHTDGELVDSYQGLKWQTNKCFQHPVATVALNGADRDYWVGDLVVSRNQKFLLSRFCTINHQIKFQAVRVTKASTYNVGSYILHANENSQILDPKDVDAIICNRPEVLSLTFPAEAYNDPHLLDICEKTRSAILSFLKFKRPADNATTGRGFMRVKVVPINLLADDMSGNRTKKHNKFDSWILVPAALPYRKRNQLDNTYFICTNHLLSAMQMLPAIVKDISQLEKGVEMRAYSIFFYSLVNQ